MFDVADNADPEELRAPYLGAYNANAVGLVYGDKPYSAWCDHIIPKAEGGSDEDENLQTLCRSCHKQKTDAEKARGAARASSARRT